MYLEACVHKLQTPISNCVRLWKEICCRKLTDWLLSRGIITIINLDSGFFCMRLWTNAIYDTNALQAVFHTGGGENLVALGALSGFWWWGLLAGNCLEYVSQVTSTHDRYKNSDSWDGFLFRRMNLGVRQTYNSSPISWGCPHLHKGWIKLIYLTQGWDKMEGLACCCSWHGPTEHRGAARGAHEERGGERCSVRRNPSVEVVHRPGLQL